MFFTAWRCSICWFAHQVWQRTNQNYFIIVASTAKKRARHWSDIKFSELDIKKLRVFQISQITVPVRLLLKTFRSKSCERSRKKPHNRESEQFPPTPLSGIHYGTGSSSITTFVAHPFMFVMILRTSEIRMFRSWSELTTSWNVQTDCL